MARRVVVSLPPDQVPSFPDRCVACARPGPGHRHPVAATWAFGILRACREVPMCEPCATQFARASHRRRWLEIVMLAVAAGLAFGLIPAFGPLTLLDWAIRLGIFLGVMTPVWVALACWPPVFVLRIDPAGVHHDFADAGVGSAFAAQNGPPAGGIHAAGRGRRSRVAVTVALASTVALGLVSRAWPLPGAMAEHAGDLLYATAAFFLFAWLVPAAGPRGLGLAAFAFAGLVELSQLLAWPWLDALRGTRIGALLLGQGFQVADLLAYAGGALLALLADVTFLRRSTPAATPPDKLPRLSSGSRT